MPRRLRSLACAALAIALTTAGCMSTTPPLTRVGSPPYEPGSGVSASDTRSLAPFTAIEATSAVRVTLVVGDRDEAVVTTDDNLMGHVVTDVRSGTLVVGIEGSIETRLLPEVVVTTSRQVADLFSSASAELRVTGLDLGHLTATASSAARLAASGSVASMELHVLAGSTADLRDLTVGTAAVTIASAAEAYVRVTGGVNGECLASSTLHLVGSPSSQDVTTDVSSKVVLE